MLSGASISETITTLLIISITISALLMVSGCNDRREVIPEEPRLSEAPHGLVRSFGSESDAIHWVAQPTEAATGAETMPGSNERGDPEGDQRQGSAWAWLQARQGANLQATVANYQPDYDIQNRPSDYGVILQSDLSQWRTSQTLKF